MDTFERSHRRQVLVGLALVTVIEVVYGVAIPVLLSWNLSEHGWLGSWIVFGFFACLPFLVYCYILWMVWQRMQEFTENVVAHGTDQYLRMRKHQGCWEIVPRLAERKKRGLLVLLFPLALGVGASFVIMDPYWFWGIIAGGLVFTALAWWKLLSLGKPLREVLIRAPEGAGEHGPH